MGSYTGSPFGDFDVVRDRRGLFFVWKSRGYELFLSPVSPDEMYLRVMAHRLRLERDEAGRVTGIRYETGDRTLDCPRSPG